MGSPDRTGDMIVKFCKTAIILFLILIIDGCSIVGFGIGTAVDRSRSDEKRIDVWEIGKVDEGTRMTIFLNDGSAIEGEYGGLAALPDSDYLADYRRIQNEETGPLILPQIGDTIRISTVHKSENEYRFRCFIYKYIKKASEFNNHPVAGNQFILAIPLNGDGYIEEIALSDIQRVETMTGIVIEGDNLREYSRQGRLPLKTAAVLKPDSGASLYMPVNQISSISIPRIKKTGKTLFIVGLVIDIVAALVILDFSKNYPEGIELEWP